MDKEKENNDHLLNIRVPQTMFEKFKDKCAENYKTMSEALRDLIQEYIKRKKGCRFAFNNKIIQDLKSENCGYFCISLLLYLKRHKGDLFDLAEKYTELFDDNTKLNDSILKHIFVEYSERPYSKLIQRLLNEK